MVTGLAVTAVADAIFGNINPSGKLPMTFEKQWADNPAFNTYHDHDGDRHVAYTEGIFIGYRGYDKHDTPVQYPFGHGLSYSTFRLSDIKAAAPNSDGEVEVSCRLTNTGKRAGAQVVQAYVSRPCSAVERPVRELKSFEKVYLEPGKSAVVRLTLPRESFAYYSVDAKDFTIESGEHKVELGFSSRDIKGIGIGV